MIRLLPTNNRFKRLIAEYGDIWIIINKPMSMYCFDGQLGVTCRAFNKFTKISNFKWIDVK